MVYYIIEQENFMKKWRIKELSDLTKTSVRMLRHYDKIGLLKPSYRESYGYRCYTEPDLVRLQQIIALKYFGFKLSTIKDILQDHTNIYAHLQAQGQVIKKEADHLYQVHELLANILKCLSPSESPDWQDLIKLIERFNMTENLRDQLEKSWAGENLTGSQFEEYLFLYEQFPAEFVERDEIINRINENLVGDPEGEEGEKISDFMHKFAKQMKRYFLNNVKLGSSLLESIQSGKLTQLELSPEGASWLSRAILSYWLKRWDNLYEKILINLQNNPQGKDGEELAQEWRYLIEDYFSSGSKEFMTGLLLWQEFARQNDKVKSMQEPAKVEDMIKEIHIKILFNPEASSWIVQALDFHSE